MATDTGPLVATADFKASSFPEGTVYRLGQYLYYNFLEKIFHLHFFFSYLSSLSLVSKFKQEPKEGTPSNSKIIVYKIQEVCTILFLIALKNNQM